MFKSEEKLETHHINRFYVDTETKRVIKHFFLLIKSFFQSQSYNHKPVSILSEYIILYVSWVSFPLLPPRKPPPPTLRIWYSWHGGRNRYGSFTGGYKGYTFSRSVKITVPGEGDEL
jgi:hypothetical protein